MNNNNLHNNNLDSRFQDAFDKWEAPHSDAEMQLDWSKVSAKVSPSAPSAPQAAGLGKWAAWIGGSAAVVTSAVILYNIYVSPAHQSPNISQQVTPQTTTEQPAIINEQPASEKSAITIQNKPAVTQNTLKSNTNSHTSVTSHSTDFRDQINNNTSGVSSIPSTDAGNNSGHNENNSNNITASALHVDMSATTICTGGTLALNASASKGLIQWGDGFTQPLKDNNSHIFSRPGTYKVLISSGSQTAEKTIKVIGQPGAHFNFFQYENNEVRFKDLSENATSWHWNFGDGYSSTEANIGHFYKDTGLYKVTLAVQNAGGCSDTGIQWVHVTRYIRPERQNAITPNGDHMNDELVISLPAHTYFHLMIVDRSGRLVFESNDINYRWNGNLANGEAAPSGTYFYILQYRLSGDSKIQQEQSTLDLRR
jgi:gliding motility-associated-like protein